VNDTDVLALKEADLSHHITNSGSEKKEKESKESKDSKEVKEIKESKPRKPDANNEPLTNDFPIHEALNLLKGISIIQAKTNAE